MPAVTELVISELLWLNYNNPEKQIYVYLNSIGTQTPDGQAVGFETEAYAILDTLGYIRPEVYTLVIGQAFGNAAMIAACGKKVWIVRVFDVAKAASHIAVAVPTIGSVVNQLRR